MPRRRHDSSSSDSDSSDEDRGRKPVILAQPRGNTDRRPQKSSDMIPEKKRREDQSRRRKDSGSSSSDDSEPTRSKGRRRGSDSDKSDGSPVKRSVVSKVEKSMMPRQVRGKDKGSLDRNRGDAGEDRRRDARDTDVSQKSNRRKVSPPQRSDFTQRSDNRGNRSLSPSRRQASPNRGHIRDSLSPRRQRGNNRANVRDERQNRSLSNDRNLARGGARNDRWQGQRSPDRNYGRNFDRGQMSRSPAKSQSWQEQPNRDRMRNDQRDRNYVQRDFENRGNITNRNRANRGRSLSPQNPRDRIDIRGGRNDRNTGRMPQRSRSPETQRSNVRKSRSESGSPDRRGHQSPLSPPEKGKKSKKSVDGSKKRNRSEEKRTQVPVEYKDSDQEFDSRSNASKKSKKGGKKSKEVTDKDDTLESSFERSKKYLGSHSDEFDIPEPEETELLSPPPTKIKSKGKRQRESDSESGSPKKIKKVKEKTQLEESPVKKSKKKSKKENKDPKQQRSRSPSLDASSSVSPQKSKSGNGKKGSKKSFSRSPNAVERSGKSRSDLDRSKSSEGSYGRHHDMAQFESEPESGEITDSEEEGRQAMKSLVNKPLDGDDPKQLEDERFLAAKKMADRLKTSLPADKPSSRDRDRPPKRKSEAPKDPEPSNEPEPVPKKAKPADSGIAALTGRTGGAYIPPARLRAMQAKITDKSSVEFQRISWEALKKSINGLVNKVNVANIEHIVRELFQENIVRGRGLMSRSIIQAQAASPTFTHVYAALVAVVNTKFPQNGELILRRLVVQFRRGYKRNDKALCLSATKFVAHLVNQQVAHEVLALEILTLLLETPTDDSVEVAIGFLKECGQKLTEVTPRGINAIFERLRNILHEGQIDLRVQYMVEVMFAVRKDQFKDYHAIIEDLDLVEEEDQFTHLMTLEEAGNPEDILNVFKADPDFQENEEKYAILKKEILGEGNSDDEGEGSGSGSGSDDEEESEDEEDEEAKQKIIDQTETNMVALKRTIYLTIQSSLDFEECAHKLMKMDLKPGQEVELCYMILDCCAQMRTYEKFFGLLAGRFCMIDRKYVEPFQAMFKEQYETIHRLETNKLRNVAKFFAHLLHTDSISWAVLLCIKLNEDDTTSASRIFIKILFQELSEYLGLPKLNDRLKDPTLQEYYMGLLPRDNPRDTRFAINFFTTIGLGGLTDDLRDHLKNVSKKLMQQKQEEQEAAAKAVDSSADNSSDSSADNSSSDSSASESDSSSDSDSSDGGKRTKRKNKKKEKTKGKKKIAEKEKNKGKTNKKGKDKSNGTFEKSARNEKDSKKNKKKGKGVTEEDKQKEQLEKFRKLAKLADYGDLDNDVIDVERGRKGEVREKKKDKKNKDKKGRRSREREEFGGGFEDPRARELGDRGRGFSDSRQNLDRSYETQSSFDSRDGRGSGWNDRGSGLDERGSGREDRRRSQNMRGNERDTRGSGLDERGSGREERGGREGGRRGKKGRDVIDYERGDKNVVVERTFERLDMYEDKFEREREKNIETLRYKEEFEDFYRGRDDDVRGGAYIRDGRDAYRGGRDRGDMIGRFDRAPPIDDDRRHGRNKGEEGVIRRDDRRKRR